ncbi:AraC family transcriptional regulator [Streptomyces mayteni]
MSRRLVRIADHLTMDVLADMMVADRIGGVVTVAFSAAGSWGVRSAPAPTAAFHAVTHGSCWLRRPDAEPVRLVAGDVAFLPLGGGHGMTGERHGVPVPQERLFTARAEDSPHRVALPGDGPATRLLCVGYRYAAHAAHPARTLLPPLVHIPAARGDVAALDVRATLGTLGSEARRTAPGARTITGRLTDVLLVQVLRAWLGVAEDADAETARAVAARGVRDPEIARALAALHREPAREWTVAGLAEAVGLSRATLSRRFRQAVGEPPLAHLTRRRIDLAARRLRDTDDPLHVIAQHVGYSSEFTLSRAFTRVRGVTPTAYRSHGHGG